MRQSDEYLLGLAVQGDTACFGEVTERWEQRIFHFIFRYVGSREEARDLTQHTFAKAFQNLGRLSDTARFSSWLYTIALNECRMRFRRQRRVQQLSLEDEPAVRQRLVSADSSPEDRAAQSQQVTRLRLALGRLPEEQRAVILMKQYQELKFHEIAEVIDVPLSTVKSRMYLGLKTLRRLMEDADEM